MDNIPTMSQFANELDCLRARDKWCQEQLAATELVVEQMREALIEIDANHKEWSECCPKTIKALLHIQFPLSALKADREQSEQRGHDALMKELREQKPVAYTNNFQGFYSLGYVKDYDVDVSDLTPLYLMEAFHE